jgi:uncharacterized membrane protein
MDVLPALLIGVVAGSRTMLAPAAVSWASRLGALDLQQTGFAWLGHPAATAVLTVLALGEFVTDQLPTTPSRTIPVQFGARLVSGSLCGAAVGAAAGSPATGAMAGLLGAVIGTLGGRALRGALVKGFGNDHVAATLEDVLALGLAWFALR